MIKEVINIPDLVGTLVSRAWDGIDSQMRTNNDGVQLYHLYLHGTPREIAERVAEKGRSIESKNKRFPLIALVHNYTEVYNDTRIYCDVDFTIWIMHLGRKNAPYASRYTDNFVPFLYPIWQAIVNEFSKCGEFMTELGEGIVHDKTDRPNWGAYSPTFGNDGVILNERLDGIELNFKGLRLNYRNCLRTQKKNIIL